jgi:glycosyltransferase involved in cell wall biosynthesis
MAKLECALAGSLLKPLAETPLLSVVIPSYNRPQELSMAVQSIASQLTGGLEHKVEILISDNGSGADTVEAIKSLAGQYGQVSYMLNAQDQGGFFNLFAAPWRARGAYTWTFGSDDFLLEGGVASVVTLLEKENPSFLTLNKRAANASLDKMLMDAANSVETRRFNTFVELFCAIGINQLAFISAQVEKTEAARAIDPEFYLRTDSRHPHVAAFLEKHAHAPACYSAETHVVHRLDNSTMLDYHGGNFFDYGVTFPVLLLQIADKVGAPKDFLERITGLKRITDYKRPQVTFVDCMFENMLRALYTGRYIPHGHWRTINAALSAARSDRKAQLAEIWTYSLSLEQLERKEFAAKQTLQQARNAALETSKLFTQPTGSQ